MSYTVYTFTPGRAVVKTQQPKVPSYDECVAAVGGYIQEVPYFTKYDGRTRGKAYADEEGKLKGAAYNTLATEAWREALKPGSYDMARTRLNGTIIIYFKDKNNAV